MPLVVALLVPRAEARPRYAIVDLTEIAGALGVVQCDPLKINDAGQIVGYEVVPEFCMRAIFWDSDLTPAVLGTLPDDNSTWPGAINNDGVVAGMSQLITWELIGHIYHIYEDNKASTWTDGEIVDLNALVTGGDPLDLETAYGINDDGLIVGFARPAGSSTETRGFLFEDGIVTDLGELDTDLPADRPRAVNRQRQIVGHSGWAQDKAFIWEDGVLTDLHEHPAITGVTSRAWDINDAGVIVGEAQFHISQPESPTIWEDGEPINFFGDIYERPQGVIHGINDRGQMVGHVTDLDDLEMRWTAFIIEDGEYRDLSELIPSGLGWEKPMLAFDINERGQIVGSGLRYGMLGTAFLMTPIPAGDVDLDGDVDLADLATLLAAYDTCAGDPGYDSAADLDESGCIDLADLGVLLADYGTGT
jgi:probable HAF family extracellular repeat protein